MNRAGTRGAWRHWPNGAPVGGVGRRRRAGVCGVLVGVVLLVTIVGPWLGPVIGDSGTSTAFAYETGGAFGLGYDYLGRPVLPQLLEGGRSLLIAAFATAAVAQAFGLATGLWIATQARGTKTARFFLDVALIVPLTVAALIAYTLAGSSLYATIPIATALTVPFTSRYYQAAGESLLRSAFFEQARVAGDRMMVAVVREVVPVLLRPVLVDLGLSVISAIYLMSTVSYLGAVTVDDGFLWPTMVAQNLGGVELNPWAALAPMCAIIMLTVPLNLLVGSVGERQR
ncbi:MAG: ABC transporter permease subunit [Actinomycetaceae bacterium]|nr:ABC transporter permease subunit [Actinomycetaceae bacterium]